MTHEEALIADAQECLAMLNGWRDGYKFGSRLDEEPYILVRAAVIIGDYINLLSKETNTGGNDGR